MRALVSALLLAPAWHVAAGELHLSDEAIATLRAYSAAATRGDCASALRRASPALTRRLESRPDGIKPYCDFLAEMSQAQVVEQLHPPSAIRAHGRFRIAVIPNLRTALKPPSQPALPTEGAYVLHSEDDGHTWYVLDLGCVDARWLKEVYPPYDGDPPVPRAGPRLPELK